MNASQCGAISHRDRGKSTARSLAVGSSSISHRDRGNSAAPARSRDVGSSAISHRDRDRENSAARSRAVGSAAPQYRSQPIQRHDCFLPDDAPPIPLAQLDANMQIQEKIRFAQMDNVGAGIGNISQGDMSVVNDDEDDESTIMDVYEGSQANRSQPLPPPANSEIHSPPSVVGRIIHAFRVGEFRLSDSSDVLSAMVQVDGEVVVAQRVGFFERKWKPLALLLCVLLAVVAIVLSLYLTDVINIGEDDMLLGEELFEFENSEPTLSPSLSPTYDPRPTLDIVQARGYIRCGLGDLAINSRKGFYFDLCRSVAAVVVGNPDGFEGVPTTFTNRWRRLHGRTVDLVILGDTHNIEREVKEISTGAGFSFSSVFNYDGIVYIGNQTFVHCAEEQKRYAECSSLMICVTDDTSHYDFLNTAFPSDYFKAGSSYEETTQLLLNGTCNVAVHEKSYIQNEVQLKAYIRDGAFIMGTKMKTKEPLAIVTRNDDREFSDIVNWVVQALFFGEEQGQMKDLTLCEIYTDLTWFGALDLDYMNAVYCVGNYGEIFDGDPNNRAMNQINNGTGMLYAIPFGNLEKDATIDQVSGSTLAKIRNKGSLNCGLVGPNRMGVEYCRIISAALLNGDPTGVKFKTFPTSKISAYIDLANGEIDILVGDPIERRFDFRRSLASPGFHFSTPYYYGNEAASDAVSFYSIVTREDDVLFASFVNCIVLATIYAQENNVQREKSSEMPLVSVFGSHLNWALRDAIFYSGSYDQIYSRNYPSNVSETFSGRNNLNEGGPLMHSLSSL